ncbi:hypothetical protein BKA82DRAFT_4018881 [Pisolithus tinctorius]|nr:hypothetical protein BKA82DRAFT_4018881 [Pisolithus tinctorius]
MEKFSDRYQFNKWKSIFNQVFEVSWEGTAVEVVRAAMAEHGVVEPSSAHDAPPAQASSSRDVSHVVLSPQAPSSQTRKSLCRSHCSLHPAKRPRMSKSTSQYLDISAQENKEDKEDKEEDKPDDKANHCPRVTKIALSGRANLTQQLESLFHRYSGEGSAEGSRAKAHQQGPVHSVKGHMEAGMNRTQPRVFKIMPVPMEEMEPFVQPSDIPVHSWVHLLTSGLKNEIAYVKRIEDNLVYLLVIPWNLPYISSGENSAAHQELFDMDLACQHGLEVILILSPEGRTIAHCLQSQYHCGLLHRRFQRHNIKPVAGRRLWKDSGQGVVNEVAYIAMDVQGESVIVCLDNPTLELPTSLEISIHDFKHKFRSGDSVDIIASPHHGFEGMVFSVDVIEDMALLCGNSRQQASQVEEHFIEPRDMAFDDEDAKGDKGKSKAQVPEVPSKDSDSDGADNEEVIIVSLDDIQVTAQPTLQFSKEKGWDVSKGDLIQVIQGPAVDVKGVVCSVNLITATLTLESEDGPWNDILDVKYGSSWVQIRDTVGCCDQFGILLDGTPLGPSCLVAFNHITTPPLLPSENPSADPGPSNPWVTTPDDVNPQHHSEQEQQTIDYRCMSWLFDNDFCNFSKCKHHHRTPHYSGM